MYLKTQGIRQNRLGMIRRRPRRGGVGEIDWGSILTTSINDAATVAKVAVTPPMYSSVVNPMTGQQSVTSYAGAPGLGQSLASPGLTSIFSSPAVLLLGLGFLAVLAFRR